MTPASDPSLIANSPAQAKRKRGWFRFVLYGLAALLVIALIANWVWVASGSNQWKLATDKEGVQVWTLKTPGSGLLLIKAHTRVDSRLAGMIKLLEDLDSCVDAHCYDGRVIEQLPSVPGRYAAYVTFKFDLKGLKPREYVLLQEQVQDRVTRQVRINIIAAPDRLPRDPCCVRITRLHNHWKLTPLPDGKLDIDFQQDTDIGGLPYVVANLALIEGTYQILHGMQDLMNMEKYRNAHVGYVQELGAN
ncbi:hypothetical protein AWB69_02906 [Caballeronia udeis]|uniref:START domain-containing protein n=1 Tax=Caballeronia udeis TaxID=1232866 RepID=A0A158GLE9_9BURK|nr:hypothetical protein [Caballeronia udeis]SAL32934.1 hypothetical protein AWB69_02906 [Caballeronia udeis]